MVQRTGTKRGDPRGYTSAGSMPSESSKNIMSLTSVTSGGGLGGKRSSVKDSSHNSERIDHRGSVFSARMRSSFAKQKVQKHFRPINGPVIAHLSWHFFGQGILLIVSHFAGWFPLHFWALPLYIFCSYLVVQIAALMNQAKPESLVPFYLTIVPYAIFHVLSRDARAIFGILWYASLLCVCLQSGSHKSFKFLLFLYIIFTAIFAVMSVIMDYVFSYTAANSFIVADHVNPAWPQEITCIVAILAMTGSVYFLQKHIMDYAMSLIERQNVVARLFYQNVELKRQLKEMKLKDTDLDLDSPITKVIKVIRDIQIKCDLSGDMQTSLDKVVDLLSKNQLFLPNLNPGGKMDADVSKWLNSMITNQSHQNEGDQKTVLVQQDNIIEVISRPIGTNGGKISEVLESVDTWGFNIFQLAEVTNGRPLFYLGMHFYDIYNFKSLYQIEESTMARFLEKVESSYQKNPYHNSTHAADVMHAVHYFLSALGLNELVVAEDCFAGLIAAAIHDVDHPGVNNAFLINTSSPLALRYNDQSVLENYHSSKGFEIMQNDPSCNILAKFPLDRWKAIRGSIVSMVLATDMVAHFEYIAKFENKINGTGLNFTDAKDRQLAMDIAIKCGDINNASKPNEIATKWSYLIMEEFFAQGDNEKERGVPVSMFMDRTTTDIPKCQVGFIDYVVTPLYKAWDTYLNEDDTFEAMKNLAKNRDHWKSMVPTQAGPSS